MIEAYHGTTVQGLTEFTPFSHFGTFQAAKDRSGWLAWSMRAAPTIYRVQLDIRKPLKIRDRNGMLHGVCKLLDMLHYDMKVLTSEERGLCFKAGAGASLGGGEAEMKAALVELMEEKGYDGFIYTNRVEDPGSSSWVIFRSEQAVLLDYCSA